MVPVTKGSKVFGEQKLRVVSATGEYADVDLIECADTVSAEPIGVFQAQYVKYGPMVYQFNTPEELGAAIVALDPESTHDAAQLWREDEARRIKRQGGTLTPEDPTAAPDAVESETAPEEEEDVKFFKEQEEKEAASSTPETVIEEPEMPVIDAGETLGNATSTDPAVPAPEIPTIEFETSTTTPITEPEPPVLPTPEPDLLPEDVVTTTPE